MSDSDRSKFAAGYGEASIWDFTEGMKQMLLNQKLLTPLAVALGVAVMVGFDGHAQLSQPMKPATTAYFDLGNARLTGFFDGLPAKPEHGLAAISERQHFTKKTRACVGQYSQERSSLVDRLFGVVPVHAQFCGGGGWLEIRYPCTSGFCPNSTGFVDDSMTGGTNPCTGISGPKSVCQGCAQAWPTCSVQGCL